MYSSFVSQIPDHLLIFSPNMICFSLHSQDEKEPAAIYGCSPLSVFVCVLLYILCACTSLHRGTLETCMILETSPSNGTVQVCAVKMWTGFFYVQNCTDYLKYKKQIMTKFPLLSFAHEMKHGDVLESWRVSICNATEMTDIRNECEHKSVQNMTGR